MKRTLLILCAAATALAAGCGGPLPCEIRTDYKMVSETRPIRVPEGYDPLSPESRLDIPPASTPPDVDQKCLEKPPRYFDEQESAAGS